MHDIIAATTEDIAGYQITETLGIARGNVIRAKHLGTDFVAGLRNLVGGEMTEYTKMISEAREQAYDRMVAHAVRQGADAVVGVRFTTSTITDGAAEILAFGTAVRLSPKSANSQ